MLGGRPGSRLLDHQECPPGVAPFSATSLPALRDELRIGRLNDSGQERLFVVVDEIAVTVNHIIEDWARAELERGALEMVRATDLSNRPRLPLQDLRVLLSEI